MQPELDKRTLNTVHCFSNIASHFSRWKVAFSLLIELKIFLTVRVQTKNRTTCFFKTFILHAYICEWRDKRIKIAHISRPAQYLTQTSRKSSFKVYSFKMMQPLKVWGFTSHFEGLAEETTSSTFWIVQLLKIESKLHETGLKCWFSITVADSWLLNRNVSRGPWIRLERTSLLIPMAWNRHDMAVRDSSIQPEGDCCGIDRVVNINSWQLSCLTNVLRSAHGIGRRPVSVWMFFSLRYGVNYKKIR